MKTRLPTSIVLYTALALPALAAPARAGTGCRAQMRALCPDTVTPTGVHRCLAEHAGELPACGKGGRAATARHKDIHASCAADISALCPATEAGHSTRACLHHHRGELSVDCAEALAGH